MRETGPVRKELDGDEAAPYIGQARTLLGVLKNDMRFGRLRQGARSQTLPDGTTITVRSIFGQDKISVFAPAPAGAVQETPATAEAPAEVPEATLEDFAIEVPGFESLVVCGTADSSAWVWSPGKKAVTILPPLTGHTQAAATGISADGRYIVGYSTDGFGSFAAVRWQHTPAGWVPYVLGTDGRMVAWAASRHSEVITGSGFSTNPHAQFGWSKATGLVRLPGSIESSTEEGANVSPNGKWVAGEAANTVTTIQWVRPGYPQTVPQPIFSTAVVGEIGLWQHGSGGFSGPTMILSGLTFTSNSKDYNSQDGSGSLAGYPNQTQVIPSPYKYVPTGVSDTGVVIGYQGSKLAGFIYSGGAFTWLSPPVVQSGPLSPAQYLTAIPTCIAAGGHQVGGWVYDANSNPQAFIYGSNGMRIIGPGAVNAMTALDGGSVLAGTDVNYQYALIWSGRSGGYKVVPPYGGTYMQATGVAFQVHDAL